VELVECENPLKEVQAAEFAYRHIQCPFR